VVIALAVYTVARVPNDLHCLVSVSFPLGTASRSQGLWG
jgi:hypothetical protein